jgi:hypothetical protein
LFSDVAKTGVVSSIWCDIVSIPSILAAITLFIYFLDRPCHHVFHCLLIQDSRRACWAQISAITGAALWTNWTVDSIQTWLSIGSFAPHHSA